MGDVGRGGVDPGVQEIDPDPDLGPLQKVGGHELKLGKFFIEILVDHRRFVDDAIAVDQHGHLAVGILLQQIFRLVFEIDLDEIVGNFLFGQDNPCPVGVGSSVAGVEFHEDSLLVLSLIITRAQVRQCR
jgi:hypothetical protein